MAVLLVLGMLMCGVAGVLILDEVFSSQTRRRLWA